jgi:hypothetical protein
MKKFFAEIASERDHQDAMWGGPVHDDEHYPDDWAAIIRSHVDDAVYSPCSYRIELVRIAAVAVAAIQSFDRIQSAGSK